MKRLLSMLVLLLVMGCPSMLGPATATPTPITAPPYTTPACTLPPSCPQVTMRYPGMGPREFLRLAEALVQQKFPGWYVADLEKDLQFGTASPRYASVKKKEDGTLVMTLFKAAWELCAVEDLALTLLHEYVHAKIWYQLEDSIADPLCRSAIHELHAYGAEINQTAIRGTVASRLNSQWGYARHHFKAQSYCSEEVYKDFPKPGIKL